MLFLVQQEEFQHPSETFKALQVLIFKGEWQKTAWESSFYKEKTSSVIRVNKGQHITDSVGTVNAAADYVVRPIFLQCGKHCLSLLCILLSLMRPDAKLNRKDGILKLDQVSLVDF